MPVTRTGICTSGSTPACSLPAGPAHRRGRKSLAALNGIGHAAMMTDPQFRAALAAHGLTLDPGSGEVVELAPYVGRFRERAA